jgi:glycosyltransferase involved in cell wall biosynthesis
MADGPSTGRQPLTIARVIGVLERGGAQLSALRLSAALRSEGFVTRLYAGDATDEGIALAAAFGVPVEAFARNAHLQWVPSTDFAEWLRSRLAAADLVHAHMFGAWWAAAAAVPDGVPLVASEHNAVTWPHGDHVAQARAAAGRLAAFFTHGPAARAFAVSLGVPAGRLLEGRSIIEGFDARALPGLPCPRVTFAGRLHPEKGPDVLLEALAMLPDPPATLLLGDGPLRESLTARSRALGLADRIHLPGWVRSPGSYIAGASVHVVPSREEAWSQSAVLALGLGVPVVGSAVEGLPVTLGQGRGVLVPSEDPEMLARAIDELLRGRGVPDPGPGHIYAERFTPERIAPYYADTYRRLTHEQRPTPRRTQAPEQ